MNGTRNINSFYLYVLYPCGDLFFFFTLPRLTHMVMFAPPMSPAHRVTSVHLVKSINNTKVRHADTKHRLYLRSHFIFLRVDTIDTSGICLTDLTHVHQLNQNQRLTIDCLQAKSIFWWHFMLVNHHHIFTQAEYRSTCIQIKLHTLHLCNWTCQTNTVCTVSDCYTLSKSHPCVYLLTAHTKLQGSENVRGSDVQVNHWLQLRVDELLACKANSCGA